MRSSPLTVGIVANEFMDAALGRMGGFGWAARRAAELFNRPGSGFAAVFLNSGRDLRTPVAVAAAAGARLESNGTPLYLLNSGRLQNMLRMRAVGVDVLLTIDYRPNYEKVFAALPFAPIIAWVRDPRLPEDVEKMRTLRLPGGPDRLPPGLYTPDCRRIARYADRPWPFRRTVLLANKMPHMAAKNMPTYGMPPSPHVLPNPSLHDYSQVRVAKSAKPSVVSLGRLDPIKRPWLFTALGRRFPDVDFYMMGQNHFTGDGAWSPADVPPNVHLTGHLAGKEKHALLSGAWVLVNTSIHEESPVSVLEALAHETPVISYEDWGDLVARHGIAIGQHMGTGEEGLPALEAALRALLTDHDRRLALGQAGRAYVEHEHNDACFLDAFRGICLAAGVPAHRLAADARDELPEGAASA
jgi:glycosyltransferase involved in cell wall biosynthesis